MDDSDADRKALALSGDSEGWRIDQCSSEKVKASDVVRRRPFFFQKSGGGNSHLHSAPVACVGSRSAHDPALRCLGSAKSDCVAHS